MPAARKAAAKPRTRRQKLVWRHLVLEVRHTPDYLSAGHDHIEIEVTSPAKAPCPLTETGYRSHFMPAELLAANGGPVAFVTAWLDREAKSKAWAKLEAKWRQLEFELVMPTPEAKTPTATPHRRRRAAPRTAAKRQPS